MPYLKLVLPDAGEVLQELASGVTTIGRIADNSVVIADGSVSSRHAQIVVDESGAYVEDLGSTNGSRVNGAPLEPENPVSLFGGEAVRFGQVEGVFLLEPEEERAVEVGEEQELPEAEESVFAPAQNSKRPDDFANTSPFQKRANKKDPLRMGALALGGLAMLVFGASIAAVFAMAAPF